MTKELSRKTAASEAAEAQRAHVSKITGYLRRYPELAEHERADLISGYRQLSNLDIAYMLSDPDVAAKLQRFRAENKRETREPFRNYAVLLALAIIGFAMIVYYVLAII